MRPPVGPKVLALFATRGELTALDVAGIRGTTREAASYALLQLLRAGKLVRGLKAEGGRREWVYRVPVADRPPETPYERIRRLRLEHGGQ